MASDSLLDILDGMTRDERRIQALDPSYIKIDDRKISDMLKFMADMAGQVNYYNEKNRIDGDWQDFFRADINVLVVLVTEFDLTSHLIQFEKIEIRLQSSTDDKEALAVLRELFAFIDGVTSLLANLGKQLSNGPVGNKAAAELAAIIEGFDKEIKQLDDYHIQAKGLFGKNLDDTFGKEGEVKQMILTALPSVKKAFIAMRSKYNNFLGVASFYFKDQDISAQEYSPHLALCITFLHLYQFLQQQLNGLPREHLDFYYKEVLGMKLRRAVPDSVHVVFEPVAERTDLKKSEELLAEAETKAYYYALNEDISITPATIADLKTLYLDEHIQVISPDKGDDDVTEVEIYKASHKSIQANSFLKQHSAIKTWPILGESQFELADDDRTMEDTDVGILLASPVLYLTEGQRTIVLTLNFEGSTFKRLIQYFRNFARVTKKLIDTVSYELLSDAFVISFTTDQGWEEIKHYSVKLGMAENSIEIKFELSPVSPALDIYNSTIHGDDYGFDWPVVKLMLNTYSTHNPFSFFRKLILERVTIRADVKGGRSLKLQNNIGTLSADNPFQPFGPQPSAGSYLDIKNTNIFNRFTKDFCIRMEWIDLPRDIGGWDTYYQEYNAGITSDSFKVKLSALSQGKFKPSGAAQQEFRLFEIDRGEFGHDLLSEVSQISDVDIKRLEMPNRPLLEKEALVNDINFTEGAVRIEFSSPLEGFGSRLYPQIFPEIIVHNSKRFVTKKKLPNPPYIPIVKSIMVDYTLEHSEVLIKTSKNEDSSLKVIHQYPFGYELVYPESDNQPYHFIPDFDHENNLYIGITHLIPKQELTLLFQLEEKNFSDSTKEPEALQWSYMYDNDWIKFGKGEVLYDTTNNFINTGIVKIRVPEDISLGNTRLSPDLYWLRASCRGKVNMMSRMIGVYPHAAIATRILEDEYDTNPFRLPANSVKSFRTKITGLNSVFQLFSSYGGTPAETDEEYYVRVSERLRHRKRLVTGRDIEEAILDEFPEILMAKCISPDEENRNLLRIILVPGEQGGAHFSNEQPKVNMATLFRIKTYLRSLISPFVDVEAENPVYEKIKIVGKIKFKSDKPSDDGLYLQLLGDDIRQYFCPWLYETRSSFKIGTQIYVAEVLNFIKKRSYVDYITGFSILHFYTWQNADTGETLHAMNDLGRSGQTSVRGSVPEAVIIPSEDHLLTVIDKTEYAEPEKAGIGNLILSEELLVYNNTLLNSGKTPGPANVDSYQDENEHFSLFISHHIK